MTRIRVHRLAGAIDIDAPASLDVGRARQRAAPVAILGQEIVDLLGAQAGTAARTGFGAHAATSEAAPMIRDSAVTPAMPRSAAFAITCAQYFGGIELRLRMALAVPYSIDRSAAKSGSDGQRLMTSEWVIQAGYYLYPILSSVKDMTCTLAVGYFSYHGQ